MVVVGGALNVHSCPRGTPGNRRFRAPTQAFVIVKCEISSHLRTFTGCRTRRDGVKALSLQPLGYYTFLEGLNSFFLEAGKHELPAGQLMFPTAARVCVEPRCPVSVLEEQLRRDRGDSVRLTVCFMKGKKPTDVSSVHSTRRRGGRAGGARVFAATTR